MVWDGAYVTSVMLKNRKQRLSTTALKCCHCSNFSKWSHRLPEEMVTFLFALSFSLCSQKKKLKKSFSHGMVAPGLFLTLLHGLYSYLHSHVLIGAQGENLQTHLCLQSFFILPQCVLLKKYYMFYQESIHTVCILVVLLGILKWKSTSCWNTVLMYSLSLCHYEQLFINVMAAALNQINQITDWLSGFKPHCLLVVMLGFNCLQGIPQ